MIIDVASSDVVAVYRALVEHRGTAADRLGHDGRRRGAGESRAIQLLQRVRRQSADRRLFADLAARRLARKTRCSTWKRVGEFVVNAAVEDLAEQVNATSPSCRAGRARPSMPV